VVFFDATFKHSETAKKRFLDTVSKPVWEHHCLDNSFIYENFDYENLLKHMKKLKERQKKYCFFMIVKEDKSHGLVVFNRTNVGIIELICIGLSEKNQKFIQTLINFQNQNMLENSIVMFLLVQYSLEIAEEKINEVGYLDLEVRRSDMVQKLFDLGISPIDNSDYLEQLMEGDRDRGRLHGARNHRSAPCATQSTR
jgi:hypothetical protein